LHGVRDESTPKTVERQLLKLDVFDTGGIDVATEAARNYRMLRSRGYAVRKTIDCLIATFCIREHHSLLHRDRISIPSKTFLNCPSSILEPPWSYWQLGCSVPGFPPRGRWTRYLH
jgi:predicted nucleic acid-binding protein